MIDGSKPNLNQEMQNYLIGTFLKQCRPHSGAPARMPSWLACALITLMLCLLVAGCQTPPKQTATTDSEPKGNASAVGTSNSSAATNSDLIVLREGDTLRVSFPGAENL